MVLGPRLFGLRRAPRGPALLGVVGAIALFVCMSRPAPGAEGLSAEEDPYRRAATAAGVPVDVLVAVAGAESSYHPWALNIEGHQVYCHSRAEAERLLSQSDKVAIGLMQINWQFWGSRLALSKTQLLDPATNLLIGARILKEGLSREGTVWRRISNYHAGTSRRRDKYNRLVYENYLRYLRGEIH